MLRTVYREELESLIAELIAEPGLIPDQGTNGLMRFTNAPENIAIILYWDEVDEKLEFVSAQSGSETTVWEHGELVNQLFDYLMFEA